MNQILERALGVAIQAAQHDRCDTASRAIERLRTLDRQHEIDAAQYLTLEGIVHTRAGRTPEARSAFAQLLRISPGLAVQARGILQQAPESSSPAFRRFVDDVLPASTAANARSSRPRRKLLIAAVVTIAAGIGTATILWPTFSPPAQPTNGAPRRLGAATEVMPAALPDAGNTSEYDFMRSVVARVVVRCHVLLDDGRILKLPMVHGTGFVVDTEGLILTNRHVVEAGPELVRQNDNVVGWDVALVWGGDEEPLVLEGGIVHQSTSVDLAWIRVRHQFHDALPFGSTPSPGLAVRAYGFPGIASDIADSLSASKLREQITAIRTKAADAKLPELLDLLGPNDLTLIVTDGIISAVHSTDEGMMLQTNAFIHGGNSGGPLINLAGEVVGINTMGMTNVDSVNLSLSGKTVFEELSREPGICWPERW